MAFIDLVESKQHKVGSEEKNRTWTKEKERKKINKDEISRWNFYKCELNKLSVALEERMKIEIVLGKNIRVR